MRLEAWDNAHEPSEPRSFGPAHENVASFESIQQARWHQSMGAGRTFLGGGAAARGARPLVAAASRRPISSPKLGGQALTAAERREPEHEWHHGLQAAIRAGLGPSRPSRADSDYQSCVHSFTVLCPVQLVLLNLVLPG